MANDDAQFPKDEADYKKLEKLVAKIRRDLAPHSKVSAQCSPLWEIGRAEADRRIDCRQSRSAVTPLAWKAIGCCES